MDDVPDPTALAQAAWLYASAALVFFMQAGFALIESGTVRHKNSVNVALKNILDLCVAFPAFVVVGYALMFGESQGGLIGMPAFFLDGLDLRSLDIASTSLGYFLFQVTFCATAATIVSGAVAERCRFMSYFLASLGVGLVIYPVFGHWVWGGGWLSRLGYHDFAGSSVVHLVGAGVALAGVQILGPRLGRFDAQGKSRRIPASSMPLVAVGAMLLAFCWIGFNGGSAPLGPDTGLIIVNTLNAACFGGLAALLATWAFGGLAAVDLVINGFLGGLVAITACCDIVSVPASALVGLSGGFAVCIGSALLERWRLDDAVGAIPVHGFAGVVGILCSALFADSAWLAEQGQTRLQALGIQGLGAVTCLAWSYVMGWLLWKGVARITALRIGAAEEAVGLNYSEHKVEDPVAGLTLALAAASLGKEGKANLDDVRDGDLAPLAQAVDNLLQRHRLTRQEAVTWADGLGEIGSRLRESVVHGRRQGKVQDQHLDQVRETIEHVLSFLEHERTTSPSVPLLIDLVHQLRDRLNEVIRAVPEAAERWKTLGGAAERIDEIALAMRTTLR